MGLSETSVDRNAISGYRPVSSTSRRIRPSISCRSAALTWSTISSESAFTVSFHRHPIEIVCVDIDATPDIGEPANVGLWAANDSSPVANAWTVNRLDLLSSR